MHTFLLLAATLSSLAAAAGPTEPPQPGHLTRVDHPNSESEYRPDYTRALDELLVSDYFDATRESEPWVVVY